MSIWFGGGGGSEMNVMGAFMIRNAFKSVLALIK